ncbi:hypothetical protein CGCS363_v015183 [Colletotrichum siamense]|uniref:uncharacterized protein n=1 Tax=Colletotrichum siamense TaxID=690259 RepID=UPI001872732B|nr:uncharacterized protein CGCS363_v015183 [Colletotrichum siamense]KAF5482678.1 hypothetical protein CGCS363_v015183 [Colletotrichum siamense]
MSHSWMASFSGLLVLFTIVTSVLAQDLGIKLDRSAYENAQRVIYSSKLTFTADTATLFTDDQLYGLASLAHTQMQSKFRADGIDQKLQPSMMAAMALGNDVYLSSSLKGGWFVYNKFADSRSKPEVRLALERCQAQLQASKKGPVNKEHQTRASCAEVFTVHQYNLDDEVSQEARRRPPATRIVAFGKAGISGSLGPQNACGGGESVNDKGLLTWGCKQFMANEGITVARKPARNANLGLPRPFPTFTKKQISIIPATRPRPAQGSRPTRVGQPSRPTRARQPPTRPH